MSVYIDPFCKSGHICSFQWAGITSLLKDSMKRWHNGVAKKAVQFLKILGPILLEPYAL